MARIAYTPGAPPPGRSGVRRVLIRPQGPSREPVTQIQRTPLGRRPTEAQCRACEYLQPGNFGPGKEGRCCHPRGVCTSSAARLQPWDRIPYCPLPPPA